MMPNLAILPKQTQRRSKYGQNTLTGDSTCKITCGEKSFETCARQKKTEKKIADKLVSKH